MKKLTLNIIAIVAFFGLMSNACDQLKEKLKVNVPIELVETFVIDSEGAGAIDEIIDSKDNSTVSKYAGKIEGVTLGSASYKVELLDGHTEGATLSLGLGYSAINSTSPIQLLNLPNAFAELGTDISMNLSSSELNALADLVKADGKLKFYISGDCSDVISARVTVKFGGQINALE